MFRHIITWIVLGCLTLAINYVIKRIRDKRMGVETAPMVDLFDEKEWYRSMLRPEETVLWQGRPMKGRLLESQDIVLVPFSIVWGGGAFYFTFLVLMDAFIEQDIEYMGYIIILIPFIIVGIYMLFGRFVLKALRRKRTRYVVTNQRVIRKKGKQIKFMEILKLQGMRVVMWSDRSGNIYFNENVDLHNMILSGNWTGDSHDFAFYNILNVDEVSDMISRIVKPQTETHDFQTNMLNKEYMSYPYMRNGERILWEGKPMKGALFTGMDVVFIPFSMLWGGFMIYAAISSWCGEGTIIMSLLITPMAIAGFYLMIGRFIVKNYVRKRLKYAVTNQRILLCKLNKVEYLEMGILPGVKVNMQTERMGDIYFVGNVDSDAESVLERESSYFQMFGIIGRLAFYDVQNPYIVSSIINREIQNSM